MDARGGGDEGEGLGRRFRLGGDLFAVGEVEVTAGAACAPVPVFALHGLIVS